MRLPTAIGLKPASAESLQLHTGRCPPPVPFAFASA